MESSAQIGNDWRGIRQIYSIISKRQDSYKRQQWWDSEIVGYRDSRWEKSVANLTGHTDGAGSVSATSYNNDLVVYYGYA